MGASYHKRCPINIAFFTSDNGGCSYYRSQLPLSTLYDLKLADVMEVANGTAKERAATALAGCDVAVFPRLCATDSMTGICDALREDTKNIVVDYDDNIFAVSPLSPHYADYGTEEYSHTLEDGRVIDVWKDGLAGWNMAENYVRLDLIKKSLEKANLVTTTTEVLANVLRQFNPNVAVLPNCVDLDRWVKLPLKPHDDVRIFWAGGSSHYEDMMILSEVIPAIMGRFPRVRLVLMGCKFEGFLKNIDRFRMDFIPWEDVLSYPYRCAMTDADIAIIPLLDTPFNACKSAIKWIEQSALSIPSVVSYVSPYKEIYNGDNAVMVKDNDTEAWIEGISTLVRDPVLRAKIGGEARRYVENHYDVKKRAVDWLRAYESIPAPMGRIAWA